MPDVSIIIINYNTFDLTCNCIRSVIEHTHCEYEIILVDNASVETKADRFKTVFNNITLIKSPVNLGFAKGNNLGITRAKGEYILLLNSDTYLLNNAIDLSLARIKRGDSIGALCCQLLYEDGQIQPASVNETSIKANIGAAFRLQYINRNLFNLPDFEQEHYTDWVWGTFMMIPRSVIERFPEKKLQDNFFMYVEDRQWCWTIKKLGYKILYYPVAKIIHLDSGSSKITEEKRWREVILPNEYLYFKDTRSNLYALFFYLSVALIQFLSIQKGTKKEAAFYFRFAFSNFFK